VVFHTEPAHGAAFRNARSFLQPHWNRDLGPSLRILSRPVHDHRGKPGDLARLRHLQLLDELTAWCRGRLAISDYGGKISDKSIPYLIGLRNLTHFDLRDSEVSDEGIRRIEEALPSCKIRR
jgi:hypothetical protein